MTTTNTSWARKVNRIKNIVGLARCKNRLNDDIIYATLKECNMDETETRRRLTMIHDVREVASSYSVDEVYTMLKECNMDQTETRRRLKMIQDIRVAASTFSVDYVYTMLKECNMDKTETSRRLKMIQDIKVVASTYSVDEVYTLLKECNMDQSEATQRLSYFDTFEEVKKKKDMRKNVSNVQWRGAGRGNFHSSKVFNDASGGRNLSSGREYGVSNHLKKAFRPKLPVDSRKESNVGHMAAAAAKVNGSPVTSNGSHNKLAPKPSSDVTSTTKDPKAVSHQNTKYTCYVGTIQC